MQGFCKLQSQGKLRLFSFELQQGEENVIILPKQLARELGIFIGDKISLEYFVRDYAYHNTDLIYLRLVKFNLNTIELQKAITVIQENSLKLIQPLNSGYVYRFNYEQATLIVQVAQMYSKDPKRIGLNDLKFGFLTQETQIILDAPKELGIKVTDDRNLSPVIAAQKLFGNQAPSFQELGIGGLNKIVGEIIDLVLLPRLLSTKHQEMLQIEPSRGFILEGPPGTGKTLIASILGTLLKAHVKIVRGPEMVTKYVGQGAQLVRELFQEAFNDWETYGVNSPLHVILIDEIDSLCPSRGSNQSVDGGATDQIVGSFLTMIQGIQSSNNFVVIGTTNRVHTIDKALLRPGRLSHIFHVGYPDNIARKQIWEIHLQKQIKAGIVAPQIIPELVEKSQGLNGAMIKSCVTSAIFVYLQSQLTQDRNSVSQVVNDALLLTQKLEESSFKLNKEYLLHAILEIQNKIATEPTIRNQSSIDGDKE